MNHDAVQLAMQIDQVGVSLGQPSRLDLGSIINEVLRDGGFQNVGEVTVEQQPDVTGNGANGGQQPALISSPAPSQ